MERIEENIISFKDFMKEALYGENGYYMKNRELTGERGDFITPSNFSLPLSVCIKNFMDGLNHEFDELSLLEIGGGEGIFAKYFIKVEEKVNYLFYEISPSLLEKAKSTLNEKVTFLSSLDEIKEFEGFILLIEVLDAFPFRRLVKKGGNIYEICYDKKNGKEVLIEFEDDFLKEFKNNIDEDVIFEYSDDIVPFLKAIFNKIKRAYIVVIDYMSELKSLMKRRKGTARTFYKHLLSFKIYSEPGEKDITRTLNLDFLLRKFEISGFEFVYRGKLYEFFIDNGLDKILDFSKKLLSIREKLKFKAQLNYLLNPEAMGEVYKVLIFKGSNP